MTFRSPRVKPADDVEVPLKHVIEEYRHKLQHVTCVCGWEGSTASVVGAPSPWTLHVRQSKAGGR